MQRQLRIFYTCSNTIMRQFAMCDESVKLELFRSFALAIFSIFMVRNEKTHSTMYLRVAYNNAHRKILKLHMRCSTRQMYVDNDLLNFEALIRIKTNTFISRLTVSDNTSIKVLRDDMLAREKMWET